MLPLQDYSWLYDLPTDLLSRPPLRYHGKIMRPSWQRGCLLLPPPPCSSYSHRTLNQFWILCTAEHTHILQSELQNVLAPMLPFQMKSYCYSDQNKSLEIPGCPFLPFGASQKVKEDNLFHFTTFHYIYKNPILDPAAILPSCKISPTSSD